MASARSRIEFRHGLPHADAGDLRHHVVQTLDVLDVERRVDIDALGQELFDVDIALGMPAAGDVGVGEFIDERQVRAARDQGVEIHLLERVILVTDGPARKDLKAVEQSVGLFAAMRLDHADDDVRPVLSPSPGLLQHLVGLAHARSGAEKDLQASGAACFLLGHSEQRIWRRTLVWLTPLIYHEVLRGLLVPAPYCVPAPSKARLSASTLTRGSPKIPRVRPWMLSATSRLTSFSGKLRAFATRGTWK